MIMSREQQLCSRIHELEEIVKQKNKDIDGHLRKILSLEQRNATLERKLTEAETRCTTLDTENARFKSAQYEHNKSEIKRKKIEGQSPHSIRNTSPEMRDSALPFMVNPYFASCDT
jgi:chromosome segregation ATPase